MSSSCPAAGSAVSFPGLAPLPGGRADGPKASSTTRAKAEHQADYNRRQQHGQRPIPRATSAAAEGTKPLGAAAGTGQAATTARCTASQQPHFGAMAVGLGPDRRLSVSKLVVQRRRRLRVSHGRDGGCVARHEGERLPGGD
eukprot:scaffold12640_cov106-Isochrysis_galbana.AAC.2